MKKAMKKKFPLGQLLMTRSVSIHSNGNQKFHRFIIQSVTKHQGGDFGDCCKQDEEMNKYAVNNGERIVSVYKIPKLVNVKSQEKIWIITEADRSATTILFPEDY